MDNDNFQKQFQEALQRELEKLKEKHNIGEVQYNVNNDDASFSVSIHIPLGK